MSGGGPGRLVTGLAFGIGTEELVALVRESSDAEGESSHEPAPPAATHDRVEGGITV